MNQYVFRVNCPASGLIRETDTYLVTAKSKDEGETILKESFTHPALFEFLGEVVGVL